MMKHSRAFRGFTLIELMIVVALIAILTALAVPSYKEMIMKNRVSAAATEILAAMNYTRSEAITQGKSFIMDPLDADEFGYGSFKSGWVIGEAKPDAARGGKSFVDPDKILRKHEALQGVNVPFKDRSRVAFNRQGALDDDISKIQNTGVIDFKITAKGCKPGMQGIQRTIFVGRTGRAEVKDTSGTAIAADCDP